MNGAPSTLVSPGLWGFVAFFVLAIALYLLMRNMNARMRRMSYRAEELRKEAEAQAGSDRSDGSRPPEEDGPKPASGDDTPDGGSPERTDGRS